MEVWASYTSCVALFKRLIRECGLSAMSRLRFYLLFAAGSAVVLTLLSALWLYLRLPGCGILLAFPVLTTFTFAAICFPNIDCNDGLPDIVGFVVYGGLFFIQWFLLGLVIAHFFRSYRLRPNE